MGDLNNRPTVDEAVAFLWEKSEDQVFAFGPVIRLPIDGAAARYSYFVVGSADSTGEVHLDQIQPKDGLDPDQMRERLIVAISALRDEWPGILAWLVEGCLEWQGQGLRPPQAVRDATDAYLSAEDSLTTWIDEACEREPAAWEPSTALFASWSNWANLAGEYPGSIKRFSQALESRGFGQSRKRRGDDNPSRGFNGLRLSHERGVPDVPGF
jgi:hypothetical protein